MYESYAVGGDNYNSLQEQFGTDSANYVAAVASQGDQAALNKALSAARSAQRQGTGTAASWDWKLNQADPSVLGNFWQQITTDPLAAPLDSLNDQLKKATKNVFVNPMVLLLVVGGLIALVFYFGGLSNIKRRFTG